MNKIILKQDCIIINRYTSECGLYDVYLDGLQEEKNGVFSSIVNVDGCLVDNKVFMIREYAQEAFAYLT